MPVDPHAPRRILPRSRTLRGVLVRGLSLLLPPILTVVVLVWVVHTVQTYILEPVQLSAREVLVWAIADVQEVPSATNQNTLIIDGRVYTRLASGEYVPATVVNWLRQNLPNESIPATGENV